MRGGVIHKNINIFMIIKLRLCSTPIIDTTSKKSVS